MMAAVKAIKEVRQLRLQLGVGPLTLERRLNELDVPALAEDRQGSETNTGQCSERKGAAS